MGHCLYLKKGNVHTVPVGGVPLSSFPNGTIVKIKENGNLADFIKVEDNFGGTNNILLWRKEGTDSVSWDVNERLGAFVGSTIYNYLNQTYLDKIEAKNKIPEMQIRVGLYASNPLSDNDRFGFKPMKIFTASYGFMRGVSNYPYDSFNGKDEQIVKYAPIGYEYWSMTAGEKNNSAGLVGPNGEMDLDLGSQWSANKIAKKPIRPMFVLPPTTMFNPKTMAYIG